MDTLNSNSLKIGFHCLMIKTKIIIYVWWKIQATVRSCETNKVRMARSQLNNIKQVNGSICWRITARWSSAFQDIVHPDDFVWLMFVKREWTNVKHTKNLSGLYKGYARAFHPQWGAIFQNPRNSCPSRAWWHIYAYYSHDQQMEYQINK